jgi:hypothetical protein
MFLEMVRRMNELEALSAPRVALAIGAEVVLQLAGQLLLVLASRRTSKGPRA